MYLLLKVQLIRLISLETLIKCKLKILMLQVTFRLQHLRTLDLFYRYLTKNSLPSPTRKSQIFRLRNAVSNIESEFYVLKEDKQSNTFGTKEVQLLKESMRDIEHRHKQEITLLRSQVSDSKAENLNLVETLEKIDKSQKQQCKQVGKLEREINKLQDIHAKCQSSDQQSPVSSESEQPPPSDVIDKVSFCTSNKYDVLTARSETSTNMFDSLGAMPKRLAQSISSHTNVLELENVMPVEQTSNFDALAPHFSSGQTNLSYVKLPSIYFPRESHQSNNMQFVNGNPTSIYHPNEQQDQNS